MVGSTNDESITSSQSSSPALEVDRQVLLHTPPRRPPLARRILSTPASMDADLPFDASSPDRRTSAVMLSRLRSMLARHPSFHEDLTRRVQSELTPPPQQHVAMHRVVFRRSFYVLVTIALASLASHLAKSQMHIAALEKALQEEKKSREGKYDRFAHAVSVSTTSAQVTLITLNIILAVRGVKIWHLIKRLRVERWIKQISMSPLPGMVRVASWIGIATRPLRRSFRPRAALRAFRTRRLARAQMARKLPPSASMLTCLKIQAGRAVLPCFWGFDVLEATS
mmetsp:Transcript_44445/g.92791  ORF Transcript_44445/g.92791 Transcript_44445/m.92791 type:complete len:282 (-) Transcript_44445:502-1347(-)